MHAAVFLLRAGQPKRAGDAAKSGEFLGEFSWVEFDSVGVRGLCVFIEICEKWKVKASQVLHILANTKQPASIFGMIFA